MYKSIYICTKGFKAYNFYFQVSSHAMKERLGRDRSFKNKAVNNSVYDPKRFSNNATHIAFKIGIAEGITQFTATILNTRRTIIFHIKV